MSWDHRLFALLHHCAGDWPLVDIPLLGCARFGSYLEIGLMLAAGARQGRRGIGVILRCLAAVGLVYLTVEAIGQLVQRGRPFTARTEARALLRHSAERSFPSRHVASAVAMAATIRPLAPGSAALMDLVALGLALGRVRAGLHYPSDVLAGALVGLMVGSGLASDSG